MIARPNATRQEQCVAVPINVHTPGPVLAAEPKPLAPATHRVKAGAPKNLSYTVAKCLIKGVFLPEPAEAQAEFARARTSLGKVGHRQAIGDVCSVLMIRRRASVK